MLCEHVSTRQPHPDGAEPLRWAARRATPDSRELNVGVSLNDCSQMEIYIGPRIIIGT